MAVSAAHLAPNQPASDPQIVDGKYLIIRTIRHGRRSHVYEAAPLNPETSRHLPNSFALKVVSAPIKNDPTEFEARIRSEALAMLSSRHPNVVRLYDFSVSGQTAYLLMPLAEKGDLGCLLASPTASINQSQVQIWAKQILHGLSAIHQAGIVHCDLKPENFLIGSDNTVQITDFGIASLPGQDNDPELLSRGVGTLHYLAPEILNGEGYTPLTDIYSVGVSLYQLLTNNLPFEGTSAAELINRIVVGEKIPLNTLAPEINPALAAVIDRAMAKDASERYRTATDFLEALEQIDNQPYPLPAECQDNPQQHDETVAANLDIEQFIRKPLSNPIKHGTDTTPRKPYRLKLLASISGIVAVALLTARILSSEPSTNRAATANDSSLLPQLSATPEDPGDEISYFGILYDFWGPQKDLPIVISKSARNNRALVTLGIPGWSPQLRELSVLEDGGKLRLNSGGLSVVISNGRSNQIPGTAASGEYVENASKRSGHWAIWRG